MATGPVRVRTSVTGHHPRPEVPWPDGWPVPPEGAAVETEIGTLYVRSVTWYPLGDPKSDYEPFVYVVLGLRRPF